MGKFYRRYQWTVYTLKTILRIFLYINDFLKRLNSTEN